MHKEASRVLIGLMARDTSRNDCCCNVNVELLYYLFDNKFKYYIRDHSCDTTAQYQ